MAESILEQIDGAIDAWEDWGNDDAMRWSPDVPSGPGPAESPVSRVRITRLISCGEVVLAPSARIDLSTWSLQGVSIVGGPNFETYRELFRSPDLRHRWHLHIRQPLIDMDRALVRWMPAIRWCLARQPTRSPRQERMRRRRHEYRMKTRNRRRK